MAQFHIKTSNVFIIILSIYPPNQQENPSVILGEWSNNYHKLEIIYKKNLDFICLYVAA